MVETERPSRRAATETDTQTCDEFLSSILIAPKRWRLHGIFHLSQQCALIAILQRHQRRIMIRAFILRASASLRLCRHFHGGEILCTETGGVWVNVQVCCRN